MTKLSRFLFCFLVLITSLIVGTHPIFASTISEAGSHVLAGQLNIVSPENVTYNTNNLWLNVTSTFLLGPEYAKMCYSIDGQDNVTLPLNGTRDPLPLEITYENGTTTIVNSTKYSFYDLTGESTLSNLSEGAHHITVYANYTMNSGIGYDEKEIYFKIDMDSETSSIPEFPSWIVLPVFVVTTIAVISWKNKMSKNK